MSNAHNRKLITWLRYDEDSYLNVCHSWGILEVLETKLHTQLMKLEPHHEQIARLEGISKKSVKVYDFAKFWECQIESQGRVFLVTANEALQRFGQEVGKMFNTSWRPLVILDVDDLDQRFASDSMSGCRKL